MHCLEQKGESTPCVPKHTCQLRTTAERFHLQLSAISDALKPLPLFPTFFHTLWATAQCLHGGLGFITSTELWHMWGTPILFSHSCSSPKQNPIPPQGSETCLRACSISWALSHLCSSVPWAQRNWSCDQNCHPQRIWACCNKRVTRTAEVNWTATHL